MGAGSPAVEAWGTMFGLLKKFCGDRRAAIAVYSAYAGTLLIGACALGIDIGRLGILRTQMQNAADSAALAAAAQLDGKDNARARADDVARNAAEQMSGLLTGGGEIVVDQVLFFRNDAFQPASNDENARGAYITLQLGQTSLLFRPVLDILSGASEAASTTMTARAAAINEPIACMPVPLMVCLSPSASSVWSLHDPSAAGRMAAFHEYEDAGGGHVASFRFVCPPDIPNCTEAEAEVYATQVSATQCVTNPDNQVDVSAATVENGVNIRFDDTAEAADNVVYFNRDDAWLQGNPLTVGAYGDGEWPIDNYWANRHNGETLPADLDDAAGTSRYQVYLYELGQSFAKNGRQTIYPVPADVPVGFSVVTPPGAALPEDDSDHQNEEVDGFPDVGDSANPDAQPNPASVDAGRRVITAGIGVCSDLGGFLWANDYIRLFVTERADGYSIFTEIIGPLKSGLDVNYVPNARLLL